MTFGQSRGSGPDSGDGDRASPLVTGRRGIGHGVVGRREPEERRRGAGERDVVGVHERRHREPRPRALRLREVGEQVGHLRGEERIADDAGVGRVGAVGLAADPTVEAVLRRAGRRGRTGRRRRAAPCRRRRSSGARRGCRARRGRRARCATCRGSTCRSRRRGTSRRASGTVAGSSQVIAGSVAVFARPSVLVSPCSDGYWPVNSEARLGVHAVAHA